MPFVNFPYRWTWRTLWGNLSHAWYDIIGGVRNLWVWLPVIWGDRQWDYDFALRILEFKLRTMADQFERRDPHVGAERSVRQMRVCADLCKRIHLEVEDRYGHELNPKWKGFGGHGYFRGNRTWIYGERRDMAYLCRLMGKHGLFWWY